MASVQSHQIWQPQTMKSELQAHPINLSEWKRGPRHSQTYICHKSGESHISNSTPRTEIVSLSDSVISLERMLGCIYQAWVFVKLQTEEIAKW